MKIYLLLTHRGQAVAPAFVSLSRVKIDRYIETYSPYWREFDIDRATLETWKDGLSTRQEEVWQR